MVYQSICTHYLLEDNAITTFETKKAADKIISGISRSDKYQRTTYLKIFADILMLFTLIYVVFTTQSTLLTIICAVGVGVLQVGWFEAMHWCVHNSLFRQTKMNELFGRFCGFICFRPYTYYRSNHLGHHRHLGDSTRDPEQIEGGQRLEKNGFYRVIALVKSSFLGVPKSVYRILKVGLNPTEEHRQHRLPYMSQNMYRRLSRECRWFILIYGAIFVAICLWARPFLILAWLLAVWMQLFCNILFATPEHAGINKLDKKAESAPSDERDDGHSDSRTISYISAQLSMTRLFSSNVFIRYLRWNENYHAAHHAFPGAPWRALPKIAGILGEDFSHRHDSYFGFLLFGDKAVSKVRQ